MAAGSDKKAPDARTLGVVTNTTKALSAAGVLGALAVTLLINILAARHYKRWDYSTSQLYTLSPATISTLHTLERTVDIQVLLPASDPLQRSIQNLLLAYNAETSRLNVTYVDPDRHPAEFVAVQQKYGIVAGKSEDGRIVTDASVVIASGERHWFITSEDMVDFEGVEEGKAQSKLEQALTGGIRSVLGGERMKLCFSAGHGEFSLDDNAAQGLGELRDRLEKNNYEPVTVDATRPDAKEPYKDCDVLLVVGPGVPFGQAEAAQIAERMKAGMSGFFLLNPMLDADRKGQLDTGLESVTRLFGIGIANDYVFEQDDAFRLPRGTGEIFFPDIKPHATTEGMILAAQAGLKLILMRSRSFDIVPGPVQPTTILSTSPAAFGMTDFFTWVEQGGEPKKSDRDRSGPLAVGMASELPKPAGSELAHGPRLVVLGTANPCFGQNWRDMAFRGNAVLVGNIISWIAARPPILDVPPKQTIAASLHITEESMGEVLRYVLLFMPGAAILMAIAVWMRRRSTEKAKRVAPATKEQDDKPKKTKGADDKPKKAKRADDKPRDDES